MSRRVANPNRGSGPPPQESFRDSRQSPKPPRPENILNLTNPKAQQVIILAMVERLEEPFYMGPKGGRQNILFEVESSLMDDSQRMTYEQVKKEVLAVHKDQRTVHFVKISKPKVEPDLSYIRAVIPRKAAFSAFIPAHQRAFHELYQIFMGPDNFPEFLNVAVFCRDNKMMNTHLFLNAFTKACLMRPDTKGLKFPALFEMLPDAFVNTIVVKQAEEASRLPPKARSIITMNGPSMMAQAMDNPCPELNPDKANENDHLSSRGICVAINRSYTGRDFNPENKMAYFREDMGVNSHHHHWHLIYDSHAKIDRRGELFYYMHHNLIARYDAERLSNGLNRVKKLDIASRPVLEEGYFSKLALQNSRMAYGGRQANTQIRDVYIRPDPDTKMNSILTIEVEDIRKYKDRILEAIDTGYLVRRTEKDGKVEMTKQELIPTMEALEDPGIDFLGNVVEANNLNINQQFYGAFGLHVMGHILLSKLHDPDDHHKETGGAIGDLPTAMRDPAFYRWHKFIDELFDHYKGNLKPYKREQLVWDPIVVKEVRVETRDGEDPPEANILKTHWMHSDIDLGRGLDIRRSLTRGAGGVWARVTHLQHSEFVYKITVENKTSQPVEGTFRIFMAPRDNEHGQRLYYVQQRLLFFEMDKFVRTIKPGRQEIEQKSSDSSITIPWEQSFQSLEDQMKSNEAGKEVTVCGCGWPQHMLLPRGVPYGMPFDLFVIVTNAVDDNVVGGERNPDVKCKESLSFCGILNKKYPDSKPMGFPFDRNAVDLNSKGMNVPPNTLSDYVIPESNMKAVEVTIVHESRRVEVRENKITQGMPVKPPERATSKKTNGRDIREGRDARVYFEDDY